MSQEKQQRNVWVCGIYHWPASITKEERHKNKNYPRHNWVDIDTTDIENYVRVLEIYKKNRIDCIWQKCGKGGHFWGDLVDYETWLKIWIEVKPFADPLWQPHTLRISKKRIDEVWERPIYYNNSNASNLKPWMKSLMSFLSKSLRNENSTNLWNAMHQCGIQKYFQGTVYQVELKQ